MSGHSAGGHFSCHMQVVHSETIKGAGCSKGGPFMWGYGGFRNEDQYNASVMSNYSIEQIDHLNSNSTIDPVENLANRSVYLSSGSNDRSVPPHN